MRRSRFKCVVATALVVTFTAAVGCSHTVVIDSSPSGADVRVNGERIGTAPATYNEQTGWDRVYDVEVSKAGFRPTRRQIKQSEWNLPVTIASVGGALLCIYLPLPIIGLLWAKQLPDRVVVPLDRGGNGAAPGSGDAPAYGY